jgi:arylsulfatase A-like enzyme
MNVLVVVCNSLHIGFLGPYGNGWIETPNLDRLASEGIVFDHHFPENLTTLPTRRSWWTGRYGFPDPDQGWTPLRPDEVILPDLLWNQGVRTALISDVPYLRELGQGFGRGFDEVTWMRGQGYDPLVTPNDPRLADVRIDVESEPHLRLPPADDPDIELWKGRWEQFLRNRAALHTEVEENTGVARTVRAAIEWLEKRGSEKEPFLLWLDIFSPHGPWDPPEPYRDRYVTIDPDEFESGEEGDLVDVDESDDLALEEIGILIDVPAGAVGDVLSEAELLRLRRTYAGTVTFVDKWLGELFSALHRTGCMKDTLVIFTSDQGEPLGEHGYVRRFRPWLYEELMHTPLILRMPGGEFGGTRHHALVQTVDILPTILSALSAPASESAHGHDLLPLIRGQKKKLRDYACMGMDVEEFAIRTHMWHLVLPVEIDPDDPPRATQLYRKPEDRWDQNDVIAAHAEVAEHLELVLRRFAAAVERDELDALPPLQAVARVGTA